MASRLFDLHSLFLPSSFCLILHWDQIYFSLGVGVTLTQSFSILFLCRSVHQKNQTLTLFSNQVSWPLGNSRRCCDRVIGGEMEGVEGMMKRL